MPDPQVPGPPDDWFEAEDWLSDPFADTENTIGYDVDGQRKKNELSAYKVIGLCVPIFIGGVFLTFAAIVIVYVLHLLLPSWVRWLEPEEVEHLHNIVFGGAAGAALAAGAKKYLSFD